MTEIDSKPGAARLSANAALALGIAFCVAFALLIALLDPLLPVIAFAPDTGYAHYFWKLPDPTVWSHATAWTGYLLHQLTIWWLIRTAQSKRLAYTGGLHPLNVAALAANAFFVLLHLGQTHLTYDGLAQDVPVWSSQASVILLLVIVLAIENQRRGLAFGRRAPLPAEGVRALRKYHGYVFSWAVIYTFWFHPMEATSGHLLGTVYTALLMLQGSLFFTRVHTNRWWTLTLEVLVLFHGTLVALMQGNGMWPMFLFGFAALFVITQMHGLGLSRPIRWAFVAAYAASATFVYGFVRSDWGAMSEIVRIPVIEYALAFAVALIAWGLFVLARRVRRNAA